MDDTTSKDQPKFSQEQYEMLLRCSEKKDMSEWNEWREENPEDDVFLEGAKLDAAHLERAYLRFAHLEGANLWAAHLEGAFLRDAHLEGAKLGYAHLEGANLWYAHLEGAELRHARLEGANLREAHLEGANLDEAHLEGADFMDAHLEDANLDEAHLEGADLWAAHLEGADLNSAHLEGARLWEAHLEGADLRNAHLEGADLSGANLENANVTGARLNRKTKCRGIRVATCYGSPQFKRQAADQDFLEELRSTRWGDLIYTVWLIFADCGRSLWLWIAWCIVFAALFALVFVGLEPDSFDVKWLPYETFWESYNTMLYYSVVTFTTLGFGDVVPKTAEAAYWVMAEVILGYVMLGGLISILANKLARRSGL